MVAYHSSHYENHVHMILTIGQMNTMLAHDPTISDPDSMPLAVNNSLKATSLAKAGCGSKTLAPPSLTKLFSIVSVG